MEKQLTPKAHSKLWGTAARMKSFGERYQFFTNKNDNKNSQKFFKKLQSDFSNFSRELDQQIARGEITEDGAHELLLLRDQLQSAGL